jgi:dihydrofolate reductase
VSEAHEPREPREEDGVVLVLARAKNGVIGKGGGLPWRVPEDMKHFRRVTTGHAVIMGRKTYESIGKPLKDRRNLVISRRAGLVLEGCEVCASFDEALARAKTTDPAPRVIGGAEVYASALASATRVLLTEIDRDVEGDCSMPPFDPREWREVDRRAGETPDVAFVTLERR